MTPLVLKLTWADQKLPSRDNSTARGPTLDWSPGRELCLQFVVGSPCKIQFPAKQARGQLLWSQVAQHGPTTSQKDPPIDNSDIAQRLRKIKFNQIHSFTRPGVISLCQAAVPCLGGTGGQFSERSSSTEPARRDRSAENCAFRLMLFRTLVRSMLSDVIWCYMMFLQQ